MASILIIVLPAVVGAGCMLYILLGSDDNETRPPSETRQQLEQAFGSRK